MSTYLRTSYLRSTVVQTRLSSVAIINIERSYANRILQKFMYRIINIFGKRKNSESFLFKTFESWIRSEHVLINLFYCVKKIDSIALIVP